MSIDNNLPLILVQLADEVRHEFGDAFGLIVDKVGVQGLDTIEFVPVNARGARVWVMGFDGDSLVLVIPGVKVIEATIAFDSDDDAVVWALGEIRNIALFGMVQVSKRNWFGRMQKWRVVVADALTLKKITDHPRRSIVHIREPW